MQKTHVYKFSMIAAMLAASLFVIMSPAVAQSNTCLGCGPGCKHHSGLVEKNKITPPGLGTATWENMGPEGGSFFGVVTDPADANVATLVGGYGVGNVYRTKDGGNNWSQIGQGNFGVVDFEAYDFNTLHVAAYDNVYNYGFSTSNDGGATWNFATVSAGYTYTVCPDPTDPMIVHGGGYNYAGAYELYYYNSTDGGATYTSTKIAGLEGLCYDMAISHQNPNVLYMCGFYYDLVNYIIEPRVWNSTDGGATWAEVTSIPYNSGEMYPVQIAVDPSDDNYVYVSGMYTYVSSDGGVTWTETNLSDFNYDITVDPVNNANVYIAATGGNLFCSTDHGMTWTTNTVYGTPTCLEVAPANPSTLYCAAYYAGISKSTDSGTTWDTVCNGIYESSVQGMDVADSMPETIIAHPTGFPKMKLSKDSAVTWGEINAPPEGTICSNLLIHSENPSIILACIPGG